MSERPDRYLDLMNFQSADQAYAEVKKLVSSLSDKEHLRCAVFALCVSAIRNLMNYNAGKST